MSTLGDTAGGNRTPGSLVWITGLSGAGKTTLATDLAGRLRTCRFAVVLLDGDVLRDVFEHDLGYTLEERHRCARRYARLGRMLASQGLHVVVATISMFEDVRAWNRAHAPHYVEVYLRAPLAVRHGRGAQHVAVDSRHNPTVGEDLSYEEPVTPDLVLDNDGDSIGVIAEQLWQYVRARLGLDAD
jgi:cytidine diphosphoramidate kinase